MSKMKNAFGKMTHIFLIITMCVDMKEKKMLQQRYTNWHNVN